MERLSTSEAFAGRSVAYDVLARFFRRGLTESLRTELSVLPGLQEVLPGTLDPDASAADHYGLLGMDVLPYASTYLEEDGRLGGGTTDYMSRLLLAVGEQVVRAEAPDHISTELDLLSGLCERRAATTVDDDGLLAAEQGMLDHVLSWLPVFHFALSRGGNELYSAMSELAMQVASDHARAVGRGGDDSVFRLPRQPDLLARESTGLRQLAEFLSRPALSGFVLTRSGIERMARELGLPRGFGDRALMLGNLLGSAGTYDSVAELVERIKEEAQDWEAFFEALEESDLPAISRAAAAWRRQVRGTLAVLEEIDIRVSGVDDSG